jgi:hypothetical protein
MWRACGERRLGVRPIHGRQTRRRGAAQDVLPLSSAREGARFSLHVLCALKERGCTVCSKRLPHGQRIAASLGIAPVCTENLIRVDDVVKSLKLAE